MVAVDSSTGLLGLCRRVVVCADNRMGNGIACTLNYTSYTCTCKMQLLVGIGAAFGGKYM